MEKKYLNESRYKKGAGRKRRTSSTVRNNLVIKNTTKKTSEHKQINVKKLKPKNNKTRKIVKENKAANIITCIILLVVIAIISRAILKEESESFIPLPFFEQANDQVITIGVITNDSLIDINSNNLLLNELNKYSKDMLLEINEDYSITYKCISNIKKISNKEYILTKNAESNITTSQIKQELDTYRNNKKSVYYNKLKNIDSIQVIDENNLTIKLKTDSPYFIYNLDICLENAKGVTNYVKQQESSEGKLILLRHKNASKDLPYKVVVIKFKDVYAAAQAYKNKEINMFVTNAENVANILGKYEYNLKSYRNGETVFLFTNPKSSMIVKDELRKAVAYSIDRGGIITDVLKSKGDKIDLPYIYDEVKYKYDVYAAENLLLTNGYKKSNKVYYKIENGKKIVLELDLIVNKQDKIKVNIAKRIKNNLSSIGIKVNVEKLTKEKMQQRIKKGDYDLALASVNINNVPDISFLNNNMYITQAANQAQDKIEALDIQQIGNGITEFKDALSECVATIGIYSDVSYLIYSKDIIGIDNISYMNLLKGILK